MFRIKFLSLVSICLYFFVLIAGCANTPQEKLKEKKFSKQHLSTFSQSSKEDKAISPISKKGLPAWILTPTDQLVRSHGFQHENFFITILNPLEGYQYVGILHNLYSNNKFLKSGSPILYYNPIKNSAPSLYPKNKISNDFIPTSFAWNFTGINQLVKPYGFQNYNFLTSEYSWEGFQYACILRNIYTRGSISTIQTDFPLVYNSPVEEFIQYFKDKENFMKSSLARAEAYLPLMTSIFRESEIPEDLVYLSLVESGFNPNAYSRAGACGPWQFMKSTARRYGLRVDDWVDERRDPEKSTRAAVKYLKDLYDMFGDWYLALTAYNAGEGKVAEAIERYNSTDLWYLREKSHLKQESCDFVPKLLAAITIGKQPEEYGFNEFEFPDIIPPITKVHIPNSTALKTIAEMAGITLSELKQYNPELRSWCTPPGKSGYWIKIPESKRELFAKNFSQNKNKLKTCQTYQKHRIKSGETLAEIARLYKTNINQIIKINGIKNPRRLRPGQILRIPISARTSS